MSLTDACIIVLRYFVTWGSGWLLAHGLIAAGFTDEMTMAVAQISAAVIGFAAMAGYALYKSTVTAMMRKLLKRDDVSTIHVAPELAAQVAVPGVVATPPASP